MAHLNVVIPPALEAWVEARVAEGRYADAGDYVRDLLRRDQEAHAEDAGWLRAMLDTGLSSGVIDVEPEEVLDAIMAEDEDFAR